jgi:hypothetical protein
MQPPSTEFEANSNSCEAPAAGSPAMSHSNTRGRAWEL